jgi:hypothetical protein
MLKGQKNLFVSLVITEKFGARWRKIEKESAQVKQTLQKQKSQVCE